MKTLVICKGPYSVFMWFG